MRTISSAPEYTVSGCNASFANLAIILFLAIALAGCGSRPTPIVGTWQRTLQPGSSAMMSLTFSSNGAMLHSSDIDLRPNIAESARDAPPQFSGTYSFQNGILTYRTTTMTIGSRTQNVAGTMAPEMAKITFDGNDKMTYQRMYNGRIKGAPQIFTRK